MRAFALRDFVFMVGELQVDATGVDVDGVAQVRLGHRRAFDVPAGAPVAPGGIPTRQVAGRRLPQHEIARIALVRRHFHARTGEHLLGIAARQLAVALEAGHGEQHMAFRGIGMPVVDQALDHVDDLGDMARRRGLQVRRTHAQRAHVLAVGGGELVGDDRDRHALFAGGVVDLVVDVGDVAGVGQPAIAAAQHVGQYAKHHGSARIADVHVVVDRRPAHVHGHAGGIERREGFDAARQAVEEVQAHGGCRGDCGQF